MSPRWLFLDVVKAPDSRTFAERCVQTLLGKSFEDQLAERQIYEVQLEDMQGAGELVVVRECKGFRLLIAEDLDLGSDELRMTVGHELACTFLYDLEKVESLPHTLDKATEDELEFMEDFGEEFAHLWLSYAQHRNELDKYLWLLFPAYTESSATH